MEKDWVKTVPLHLYFPRSVGLDKYDCVILFLDASSISHDHCANVFVSEEKVPCPQNMA